MEKKSFSAIVLERVKTKSQSHPLTDPPKTPAKTQSKKQKEVKTDLPSTKQEYLIGRNIYGSNLNFSSEMRHTVMIIKTLSWEK